MGKPASSSGSGPGRTAVGKPTPTVDGQAADVGSGLPSWFENHGRDLPWRRTRDGWAVLVAEIMLQQTQVSRVVERWFRFLGRFPTADAAARAPVGDLIDEWSGLGYNRRAVNLHRCATEVVERFDGRVPEGLDDLRSLPGVGAYTARAVAVFAFERHHAVVDTNVARILARVTGRSLSRIEAQAMADEWACRHDPWVWNQALLDVGAGMCRLVQPDCGRCPLSTHCGWNRNGRTDPDPARGSAGVSGRQSTFAGSDRQGRGRLVRALRDGPVHDNDLVTVMGWPGEVERARRVAATVVDDGLAILGDGRYRLPR